MSEELKSCPYCQGKCSETFGDHDLCADCELGHVRSERHSLRKENEVLRKGLTEIWESEHEAGSSGTIQYISFVQMKAREVLRQADALNEEEAADE